MAGNNRVAVQKSIDSNSTIIHYVVENYNNEKGIFSGLVEDIT